jgi:hypothetical protein
MHAAPVALTSRKNVDGYMLLAVAIIRAALDDASNPSVSVPQRERARHWLAGSDGFAFWCTVAGLDPEAVSRRARTCCDSQVRPRRGPYAPRTPAA